MAKLREELELELDFPEDVLAEARAAAAAPRAPERDETEVPFVTIDPPGARDLDQALHVERRNGGYRVRYAIADPGVFVEPGGAVDREAHVRGQTFYAPDANARLYPPELSEAAASLLPGERRPAVVWTIDLDGEGECAGVDVRRAVVRSRAQLDYETVQRALDGGGAEEPLELLREVGRLRQEREAERGGIDLPIPDQEVELEGERYRLAWRAPLPVEGWNAQLSLLTGQAAASLMLDGRLGILRTLPRADPGAVARLRRTATALGADWPEGQPVGDFVRSLDPKQPSHAAVLAETTVLFRGSGYAAFDGEPPAQARHAGVAAAYTHATAPLRRLVDRYASETCVALCAGAEVPDWVRVALPSLPQTMELSNRRAAQYEGNVVSIVEAAVLEHSVGEVFDAVVVETDDRGGVVQLRDPAVTARCTGDDLPLGERIRARLAVADVAQRLVRFERAG